ncbi:hypothetical protein GOV14_01810 [Candidatus Pacearchaeota archaeon]|nr:hypothetical protein [Candidatus Pacearchaeota archaeon]
MRNCIFVTLCLFFILPVISSTLIFENTLNDVYNVLDNVNVTVIVEKNSDFSGYLEIYLDCDDDGFLVKKEYLSLQRGEKKVVSFYFPVKYPGKCNLFALFDAEDVNSAYFDVSDEVDIRYNVNNKFFSPGDMVIINGTIIKESGDLLEGVISVSVAGLDNKFFRSVVKGGKFFVNFSIDDNIGPGDYGLVLEAIETNDFGETVNSGIRESTIKVISHPTSIEIGSFDSIKPPGKLVFAARILDQAGNLIENESLIIKLINLEEDRIVFERVVQSGGDNFYFFESNATKDFGWDLHAYFGQLYGFKRVWVEENKQVGIEMVEDAEGKILRIKNLGNVRYDGVFSLTFKNESFEDNVLINVNLSRGVNLDHPLEFVGNYNLSIEGTDLKPISFDNVQLTGYAILSGNSLNKMSSYIFLFLVFIVILCLLIYFFVWKKKEKIKSWFANNSLKSKKKFKVRQPKLKIKHTLNSKGSKVLSAGKRFYMAVFHFPDKFKDLEKLAKKHGFVINRLNDNLYYSLTSGDSKKRTPNKFFKFVHTVHEKKKASNVKGSIILNSKAFKNSARFLKEFALTSRQAVRHASGGFLIEKSIVDVLGLKNLGASTDFFVNNENLSLHKIN